MRLLVYVGELQRGGDTARRLALELVGTLVDNSEVGVTAVGDAASLALLERTGAVLIDELVADCDALGAHDAALQVHADQRRLVEIPTAVLVHELTVHDAPWAFETDLQRMTRALHKNLLRADVVLTTTEYLAGRLVEVEPLVAGRVVRVQHPPLIPVAAADSGRFGTVRSRLQLRDRPTLVAPVPLRPEHGVWNLVDAAHELAARGHDFQLVVAGGQGDPGWTRSLRDHVERLHADHVVLAGFLPADDLGALIGGATGVVVPSVSGERSAGLDLAVMIGANVAVADVGVVRSQLDDHGADAATFDPFDVDDMVRRIADVLETGTRSVSAGSDHAWPNWSDVAELLLRSVAG